jgi:FtsP/CotA-like multicopper oxidase with cupredoxin domain
MAAAAGGTALLSAAGCSAVPVLLGGGEPGTLLRSALPLPTPFQAPLTLPQILTPVRTDPTTDYYEIVQRPAVAQILPGVATPIWSYGGTFPGPTIVSRSGRRTVVRHMNTLAHPTVTHLHGGHTPHDSDGYPADLVLPSGMTTPPPMPHSNSGDDKKKKNDDDKKDNKDRDDSSRVQTTPPEMPGMEGMGSMPGAVSQVFRDYAYPVDQRAATLWYHDHRHGFTGASVWYGLAGFHLITDDEDERLPLPRGDRDLPLMITDRSFDATGAMPYPSSDPALITPGVQDAYGNGVLGDVILVNGSPWPVARVSRQRYRLRFLNASNARRYQLQLSPPPSSGPAFTRIGSDGGLLALPIPDDTITLASAERSEVIVDFGAYSPGTRLVLTNGLGAGSTGVVMAFDVDPSRTASRDDTRVPDQLSDIAPYDPSQAVVTRDFQFQNRGSDGWAINGAAYDPARPLATPRLGELERWRFVTDFHHPIHLHLEHFQVLSRNGGEIHNGDLGWKDTIDLGAAEAAEILVRFTNYSGRYVFHCHNLEHEDMAMMADFVTS